MNRYIILKERHREELEAFPMFFAFDNKQFKEGMESLGLQPDDTDKIYKAGNTGGFYRRTDAEEMREMFQRHQEELQAAIKADETGEGFILDMFSYELNNHEYCITARTSDALEAIGLEEDEVNKNPALKYGLQLAIKGQMAS